MLKLFIFIATFLYSIYQSTQSKQVFTSEDFQNIQVNRTIDLTNHIIKIKTKILIKNNKIDPVNTYRLPLLKNQTSNLLQLEASMSALLEEDSTINLKIHKQQKANNDFTFYDLSFRSEPMNYEEERLLVITEYYANQFDLLPKKIYLTEDQYVVFTNTQNFVSYYATATQRTKIKLPVEKSKFISYTKDNALVDGKRITYLLNFNIPAFTVKAFKVHFECNFSLVVFNNVEKIHEVSHWGNIAVEERYQIENVGAKLIGEFGRVDYDDEGVKGGKNALRVLYSKLPIRANNLWYRDEIGNVSSSRAFRDWDDVKLDIELRFPLLGGWKSNYNVGYNLPTKFQVNEKEDGFYSLNLTYGLGYDDILAKNYTYKVILPEHAVVSKVNLPIDSNYRIESDEKTFSFLDLFGRTTVVITMNNVFDVHRVPIQVSKYL